MALRLLAALEVRPRSLAFQSRGKHDEAILHDFVQAPG